MPKHGITTTLVICCVISLLLTGCGSLIKDTGSIRGQVLDAQGRGMAGLIMTVEGQSIATQTDSSGWYQLSKVPIGTHIVVASNKGQYGAASSSADLRAFRVSTTPDGKISITHNSLEVSLEEFRAAVQASKNSAQSKIEVTVQRGITTMVAPIIMLPGDATLNNVVIHQADPTPSELLTVDSKVWFSFDVAYKLQASKGNLVVGLCRFESGNQVIKAWSMEIPSASAGERVLGGEVTIPTTMSVTAQAILTDDKGGVLAVSSLDEYGVVGGEYQRAPLLSVTKASLGAGVKLSWKGGNLNGFQKYEIWRRDSLYATITDPNITSFTDIWPFEEEYIQYYIKLYTARFSSPINSNIVSTDIRSEGLTLLALKPLYAVADPVRDYMYVSFGGRNVVSKMAPDGKEIASVDVCSQPTKMDISHNGSLLAVMCPASDTVAIIDLVEYKAKLIYDIGSPIVAIRVDPTGKRVYIASYSEMVFYDVVNDKIEKPKLEYKYIYDMVLSEDGQTLYLNAQGNIVALETTDFKMTLTVNASFFNTMVLDNKQHRLYLGDHVFDIRTGANLGQAELAALGISKDGQMMFFNGYQYGPNGFLFIKEFKDGAWQITDQIAPLVHATCISMNTRLRRAMVLINSDLYTVDLNIRSQARQEAR